MTALGSESAGHETEGARMRKPRVAFICVHNSCRSQIAEALGRKLAAGSFDSCSAGSEKRDRINEDAARLMKARYGIDMEKTQRPKLISELPPVDVVITMGCNVQCPFLPAIHREDWGLDDPTGHPDEAFLHVMDAIEQKILDLKARLPGLLSGPAGEA